MSVELGPGLNKYTSEIANENVRILASDQSDESI